MQWGERKLILPKSSFPAWGKASAMLPTPFQLTNDIVRVYTTFCNEEGIGRVGYFDILTSENNQVINVSQEPVLDIGLSGCFDDNGVAACSIVKVGKKIYMYYAGFEICHHIRYRILTGLAVSDDYGNTFKRIKHTPILERSENELFFRCGPFTIFDNNRFKMWYIGGSSWSEQNSKLLPEYDLRYIESSNGIDWPEHGKVIMPIEDPNEHGFGRPYVVKNKNSFELFYSIRKKKEAAYRLGYAVSNDAIKWQRLDNSFNLNVKQNSFDSQAIMFAVPISSYNKTFFLYNGNGFGADGVGIVERINN